MPENAISPKDKELLLELKNALAYHEQMLCPDFYQLLDSIGYNANHPLVFCFENLLLEETEFIYDAVKLNKQLNDADMVNMFDHFLSCIARRITKIFDDPKKIRISLEALRRLSFSCIRSILASNHTPEENQNFSTLENVLQHQQFIESCNEFLASNSEQGLCILAIQFDFGADSIITAQNILPEIVERLNNVIREQDTIVQISTRRWALCLKNVNDINVAILAATKIKKQFSNPFHLNQKISMVVPYIGIVISSDELNDANLLLQAALIASIMPASHSQGFQIYDSKLDAERKRLDMLSVKLKKALFDNELELFYQPKYSMREAKIIGVEALLRWRLPEGYVHIPSIFSLIERDGLLEQFTTWLFQTSFRQLTEFIKYGIDIKMSINILPQNLVQTEFASSLSNMLNVWKVPRDKVVIEITEGSMLGDAEQTIVALQQIRDMGLTISMDDFGTGYSSLSYLSRLPINELKIDQAFVRNMFVSHRDEAIVRTIIEMGTNFELALVAEGVENAKDAAHLSAMGCDIMQGYWISKPISAKEIIHWFNHDNKNQWKRLPLKLDF